MTKTELWTQVQGILEAHKASKKLSIELEQLLKPKAGGSIVANPPKVVGDKTYHFCRYTQLYVVEEAMVMSNGKSKGYSKLAIAKWTKLGKEAQKLNEQAMQLLLAGEVEKGKLVAEEAEQLKIGRNLPESYSDVQAELLDYGYAMA